MTPEEKRNIINKAVEIASTMPDGCYRRLSVEKDIFVVNIENKSFIGSPDFPDTPVFIENFNASTDVFKRLNVVELLYNKSIMKVL